MFVLPQHWPRRVLFTMFLLSYFPSPNPSLFHIMAWLSERPSLTILPKKDPQLWFASLFQPLTLSLCNIVQYLLYFYLSIYLLTFHPSSPLGCKLHKGRESACFVHHWITGARNSVCLLEGAQYMSVSEGMMVHKNKMNKWKRCISFSHVRKL